MRSSKVHWCFRLAFCCLLSWGDIGVVSAEPTLGVCLNGNSDRLSSDNCRCTGVASNECIGSCIGNVCTGASTVDPPICAGPNNLSNISPNGCACAVNGDCSGDCVSGICVNGVSAAICDVPGNLNNVSADGCPCNVNGDCIGNCNTLTRTCAGVVGAVLDRQPMISAFALRNQILLGEITAVDLTLTNITRSESTVRFALSGPGDTACMGFVFDATTPSTAATHMTSALFQPAATGLHRWRVFYRGNAWNLAVATPCAGSDRHVFVDSILFAHGFE